MLREKSKLNLPSFDKLFTSQEERTYDSLEKVQDIDINLIDDFPKHPFKVLDNDDLIALSESIKEKGVLVPAIVREKANGRYELISGHRRKRASTLALKSNLPCIVRNLSDDEATIVMVDSNMQREEILPSEKAFAYKMKLEAMKHQGVSLGQVVQSLDTADEIGKENDDSGRQVRRYIRLTNLVPNLLELVDNKTIAFNPAVELSYLKKDEQSAVLDFIEYNETTPSHAQAIQMKKLSQQGLLNTDKIDDILSQSKPNQIPKIKFNENRIKSVLPKYIAEDKIEDFVVKSIEFYSKHLMQKEIKNKLER